ncbi:hypothetical protein [Roseibium sp.]|uniref:hypothetical protein n=1 Tax=Roseibium sp. TaxID=1936156 RepID=UPI003A96A9DB
MRNGLYSVHFQTQAGVGTGVIYARDGKIWGGDAGLYYTGTYDVDGDNMTATVVTNRHTQIGNIVSVFGIDKVTINLVGQSNGDSIACKGTSPQAPGVNFTANLTRLSD